MRVTIKFLNDPEYPDMSTNLGGAPEKGSTLLFNGDQQYIVEEVQWNVNPQAMRHEDLIVLLNPKPATP